MTAVLRTLLVLIALSFPLAITAAPAAPLVEGEDYVRIDGGQPFATPAGKVEIAEVFGYGCPHCARFEPALARWKAKLPKHVNFVPVAGPFGAGGMPFTHAYYTARVLGIATRSHGAVFHAVHEAGELPHNPSADELAAFYARYGVTPARFVQTYSSPQVKAEVQRALQFIQRSGVEGTPSLIVAGRYRVLGKSLEDMLRIAAQLAERERTAARR